MALEVLQIPAIELEWSDWHVWEELGFMEAAIPNRPGVYEVRYQNAEQRLNIGRASNLRKHIIQMVTRRFAAEQVRIGQHVFEGSSSLELRWAGTDRRAAAQEELMRRHARKFGKGPRYVNMDAFLAAYGGGAARYADRSMEDE